MLRGAGYYKDLYTWRQHSLQTDSVSNEQYYSYSDNGTLWGRFVPLNSNEALSEHIVASQVEGKIYINSLPDLNEKDQLKDVADNETYLIDGIIRHDTELECKVHKYTGDTHA